MEAAPPEPPVSIRIAQPGRVLGVLWLGLGTVLLVFFFLPNFTMAGMEVTGPKVLEMVFRDNATIRRIFDDGSFFMMVAVPIVNLLVALAVMGLGGLAAARNRAAADLAMTIVAGAGFVFALIGGIMIVNSGHDVPFFAKLLPKPTALYWFAMVCQLLIFAAGMGHRLVTRPAPVPH